METIILSEDNREDLLIRLESVIRQGGIAVIPTDTVYGLVCDATNPSAIERIFLMKKRPEEKSPPIFVASVPAARRYAYIPDAKAKFLERVWPGAVTAVFQHKEKLPRVLTGHRNTIGIRIPDHPFVLSLLKLMDTPVAQTSANISNLPPAKTAAEVSEYFKDADIKPDLIIDSGTLQGVSSVVIDCTGSAPILLRSGVLSKEDLDRMLENF